MRTDGIIRYFVVNVPEILRILTVTGDGSWRTPKSTTVVGESME